MLTAFEVSLLPEHFQTLGQLIKNFYDGIFGTSIDSGKDISSQQVGQHVHDFVGSRLLRSRVQRRRSELIDYIILRITESGDTGRKFVNMLINTYFKRSTNDTDDTEFNTLTKNLFINSSSDELQKQELSGFLQALLVDARRRICGAEIRLKDSENPIIEHSGTLLSPSEGTKGNQNFTDFLLSVISKSKPNSETGKTYIGSIIFTLYDKREHKDIVEGDNQ